MMWSTLVLALFPLAATQEVNESAEILDLIESLQVSVKDFRCAFEGTARFTSDEAKKSRKLGQDGLYDTFSGTFVWRRGGDTSVRTYHRFEPSGRITREQLLIRVKDKESELYLREDDSPLGFASISDPARVNADRTGCYGSIFLVDQLKRIIRTNGLESSISDDQLDSRTVKVVTISFREPRRVYQRYWIDLKRSGQVVRREDYAEGNALASRLDIELAQFRIGNEDVWMPVSGAGEGYAAIDDRGRPYTPASPTFVEKLYVCSGTMEFNRHPADATFKRSYKPGTPITDNLRKLEYQFAQQKLPARPTRAESERMLAEQIDQAEKQRSELSVAPVPASSFWPTWLAWGSGIGVIVLLVIRAVQHRRR